MTRDLVKRLRDTEQRLATCLSLATTEEDSKIILALRAQVAMDTQRFKEIEEHGLRLEARLASAREALEEIKRATIEGRVCDDVAWFDTITTLHDFCDQVLVSLIPA